MNDSMKSLVSGIARFRAGYFDEHRELFARLMHDGQKPRALVVSCADSRYDPIVFTCAAPGEIYSLRIAGALVPPYEIYTRNTGIAATLEHAVVELGIRNIVVCGHLGCGAVHLIAAGKGAGQKGEALASWLEYAAGMPDRARARLAASAHTVGTQIDDNTMHRAFVEELVRLSLDNFATYSFVADGIALGRLSLFGWCFDIGNAELYALDPEMDEFVAVETPPACESDN